MTSCLHKKLNLKVQKELNLPERIDHLETELYRKKYGESVIKWEFYCHPLLENLENIRFAVCDHLMAWDLNKENDYTF